MKKGTIFIIVVLFLAAFLMSVLFSVSTSKVTKLKKENAQLIMTIEKLHALVDTLNSEKSQLEMDLHEMSEDLELKDMKIDSMTSLLTEIEKFNALLINLIQCTDCVPGPILNKGKGLKQINQDIEKILEMP